MVGCWFVLSVAGTESPGGGRSWPCLLVGAPSSSDSTSLAFAPVVGSPPDTLCTLCTEGDLPSRRLSRPSSLCHGIIAINSRVCIRPLLSDLVSACPALGPGSGVSSDISPRGMWLLWRHGLLAFSCLLAIVLRNRTFGLRFQVTLLGLSYSAGPPSDDQVSSIQVSVSHASYHPLGHPLRHGRKNDDRC